jgi:hypothetical protein
MQVPDSPVSRQQPKQSVLPLDAGFAPSESLYVDRWRLYSFHLQASRDRDRSKHQRAFHAQQARIIRPSLPTAKSSGFDWQAFCAHARSL